MNNVDKQRLWTKYYLTNSARSDSLLSLSFFALQEAHAMHLDISAVEAKKKKFMRYMLKSLSKRDIIRKYSSHIRFKENTSISKNKLIDRLLRSV